MHSKKIHESPTCLLGHHAGHADGGGVGVYNNSIGLICKKFFRLQATVADGEDRIGIKLFFEFVQPSVLFIFY